MRTLTTAWNNNFVVVNNAMINLQDDQADLRIALGNQALGKKDSRKRAQPKKVNAVTIASSDKVKKRKRKEKLRTEVTDKQKDQTRTSRKWARNSRL